MSNNLTKNSIRYTFANIFSQAIGLFRGLLIPIIFNAVELGLWNLSNVIINYGNNSHLGSLHGMNKYIPSLKGKNEEGSIRNTINLVLFINIILGIIFCFGISIFVYLFNNDLFNSTLLVIVAIIFLQQIFLFNFSAMRAVDSFKILSLGLVYHSIYLTSFTVLFSYVFVDKVFGALFGMFISFLITNVYWLYKNNYGFNFVYHDYIVRKIFYLGFPIIILGFLDLLFITTDRWLIASFLGIKQVGYYSLGIMISGIYNLIPGTISSTINQRLVQNFSSNNNDENTKIITKSMLIMKLIMLIIINIGVFFLPLIIYYFLPKFINSVDVVIVFIFSSYFYSISNICSNHLISVDKQIFNIKSLVILIVLSFTTNYCLLKFGYGIFSIAIVTSLFYTIYGIIFIYKSFITIYKSNTIVIQKFILIVLPHIILVILFLIEHYFFNMLSIVNALCLMMVNFLFLFGYTFKFENRSELVEIYYNLLNNINIFK